MFRKIPAEISGNYATRSSAEISLPVKLVPNSWSSLRACSNVARAWSALIRLFQSLQPRQRNDIDKCVSQ